MTDMEVIDIMATRNLDVRMSGTIDSLSSTKKKSTITVQVDYNTAQQLMRDIASGETNYLVGLYIINKKQFDEIKNSTAATPNVKN